MHRCYLEPDGWNDVPMELSSEESHHLVRVLRVAKDDTVIVFDGRGRSARANIEALNPVAVSLIGDPVIDSQRYCQISLIQALPKKKTMDLIVEKATELGAIEIFPVLTERVVKRPDQAKALLWQERWQKLALSASRQCGVNTVPTVHPVTDYEELMSSCGEFDLLLLGSLAGNVEYLRDVLAKQSKVSSGNETMRVGLMIGPEGDFTDQEAESAIAAGAVPVTFGQLVLRVETAAIYGVSVLGYEFVNGPAVASEDAEG